MSASLTRSSSENSGQRANRGAEVTSAAPASLPIKPLRPRACRRYLRKRVAAEWSLIVTALLDKAKQGSVSHTNLAARLAGFDLRAEPQQKRRPTEPSFAKQLLDDIEELEKKNIAEFGPL